jgi:hypothetical protein
MKKILLAATILVAMTTAAFADGKKSNEKLLGDLKTSLKNVDEFAWTTTDSYKKTSFTFNGKATNAYVNVQTGDLIGFGISIDASSLPENSVQNINAKYQGWQLSSAIMFIDSEGNTNYYAQISKGKKSLALKISAKGKPSIYAHMP